MKIGLIDLDNSIKFPNLALMKISAFYKNKNINVEWYQPLFGGEYDIVYISKIFSWSSEYPYPINVKKIIKGGIAYGPDNKLPDEIEHTYPDYSLYSIKNQAYGFLTRGCPRQCKFCNVALQQGTQSKKVANLNEFWNGEKEIILLDPNILAATEWKELFQQLIDSKAYVEFSQGLDIRLMTEEKIKYLNKVKLKMLHFAWDNYEMETYKKLKKYRKKLNFTTRQLGVYVLVNFNTTFSEDLDRIYKLRELGYSPYIMRYLGPEAKEKIKKGSLYNKLARWCNNKTAWNSSNTFEEYLLKTNKGKK
ncbi:hypothetical protein AAA294_07265 [Fusobacterium varium]|uniref:radical SAM protein n=1 Tax=Fusobacterium varium TaxID=856 RepID=UPI0032C05257